MKDGGHLAGRGSAEDSTPPPPPALEQTGAEEPRAGCINEQAVLEETGSCNADEWSSQRGEGERSTAEWAPREQRGGGL